MQTIVGLSDADAGRRSTVSELCVGGLVKHVTDTEALWVRFIEEGAAAFPSWDDPATYEARAASFTMLPEDTVDSVLVAYGEVARHTDALVVTLPSLDATRSTPDAPWAAVGRVDRATGADARGRRDRTARRPRRHHP